MAAVMIRKRQAPDGLFSPEAAAVDDGGGNKRPRHEFGSIYNYEKQEDLGEGTYGIVVKARDKRTGETVAIKWIRHHVDLRAVCREADCLAACRGHPSIVQMKEVAADEVTGEVFIVMEFVGPSLHRRLTRALSEGETRAVMRQLLAGAKTLHSTGTIHRDIKPDNILVGAGAQLKICDLGMATPVRPAGTPYPEETVAALWYRAPELVMGFRNYGTAVDMWALGCVMAELLIGEPLFGAADTVDDMLSKVVSLCWMDPTELHADLRGLSEAGRQVLRGLLSFEAEKRLTAADALSHRWFDEEDAPLASVLCPPPPDRHRRFFYFL
ncbi:hypothetical protein BS78_01G208800 [Paspalum vaginatum]|nr:hypothetical protein BS78_01G208800 [Paspalum vaginatum]